MRFYDLPRSPWCQMVRVVLADKGLPHERHIVLPGQETEDWFLGISPLGLLPVLVEKDLTIRGAPTINEYLDEEYPDRPLMPNSAFERARVRMLVSIGMEFVGSPLDDLYQAQSHSLNEDKELIEDLTLEVLDGFAILEDELDSSFTFAAGDQFTLADATLAPFLLGLTKETNLEATLDTFPVLSGYRDRLLGRAATAVIQQGLKEWHEMAQSIGR